MSHVWYCDDCGRWDYGSCVAADDWPDGVLRGVGPSCPECECEMDYQTDDPTCPVCGGSGGGDGPGLECSLCHGTGDLSKKEVGK